MKTRDFGALRQRLLDAVSEGVVPGAVVSVADEGVALFTQAFGDRRVEPDRAAATCATVYDLASVSKALATSVLAMAAVGRGALRLDDAVVAHVDEFAGADKAGVTIRHLLAHASGLPAHRPFWQARPNGAGGRAAVVAAVAREPLEAAPGARSIYSDLGFILLGAALERVAGARLDEQFAAVVARPLALEATGYVELGAGGAESGEDWDSPPDLPAWLRARPIAPTQRCPRRGRILTGEVDDLNAAAMNGVAGHAGLFSSVDDVNRVVAALVAAWQGHGTLVERDVIRTFWRPAGVPDSTWRLGWDGPAAANSAAGNRMPRGAVGHLGFTGCSLWIDPARARWVAVLANRVHPTVRDDPRFRRLRPELHDAALAALDG
jgi:CubicO group peptidase (beta-lactamase class C family)